MANYAKGLPFDRNSIPMQEFPAPYLANARYASDNATASSVISVNANTSTIEVAAIGGAAVLKWIPTTSTNPSVISAAGTENFDHVISSGMLRRFVIPKESGGQSTGAGSVVGVGATNGLYQRVAIKSVGVASVLLSEF